MTTTIHTPEPSVTAAPQHLSGPTGRRRWWALVVIAAAISLDVMGVAVVNTALPDIGAALGVGPGLLPWVMTGYAVAFAGFLLLGGRAADVLGRRRVFIAGIALYGAGSALAALAPTPAVLLAARLVQGVGAAVSGPAALALIPQVFTDPAERTRAMGVYTAVGATSFAGGLVLGGVLTQAAGWRSIFAVLAAVAAIVVAAAVALLPAGNGGHTARAELDLRGAGLVAAGLILLVFGVGSIETAGAGTPLTVVPVAAGVLLLVAFVRHERRTTDPLLPMSLFAGAPMRAATAAGLVFYTAVNGLLYFAPLYLQGVLGYSPLESGLAIVPMSAVVIISAQATARLLPRTGFRGPLAAGLTLIAAGVATWLFIGPATGYWTGLLPGIVIMSVGQGVAFTAMTAASLAGVDPARHGVAGATNITAQQVGSGLGVAVVATIASTATGSGVAGQITGYHAGIAAAALAGLLGAVVAYAAAGRSRACR